MSSDIDVAIECRWCHFVSYFVVGASDYSNYRRGGFVQECFPYLPPQDREMFISQTCPDCWDNIFGGE